MPHRIKILTDTTCDLPPEMLQSLDIEALPLHVFFGDQDHLDGVDVTRQQMFDYADRTKQLPKTAAVSVAEFADAFRRAFDQGYDRILYTGISSRLSTTYQNACFARKKMGEQGFNADNIHVVDSLQLSTGIANLLLEARKLADEDVPIEELLSHLEDVKPRLSTSFVADTLEYLHMGGRCSAVAYIAGSVFKIHPQIAMEDGVMHVADKHRGNIRHSLETYRQKIVADQLESIEPERIFITHTVEDPALVEELKQKTEELNYFKNIYVTQAGATISSHCGPGTLGFLFIKKA